MTTPYGKEEATMGKVLMFPGVQAGAEYCPPPTAAAQELELVIAVMRERLVAAVRAAGGNLQAPEVLMISCEIDVLIVTAYR